MAWQTAYQDTMVSASDPISGQTVRVVIPSSQWLLSGPWTKIRVTLTQKSGHGSVSYSGLRIQKQAGSGDDYDFSTTPVALNFSATDSITVADDSSEVSDDISLSFTDTDGIVIAGYVSGSADISGGASLGADYSYTKSGNDTTTVDATGYAADIAQCILAVSKIEVFGDIEGVSESEIGIGGESDGFNLTDGVTAGAGISGESDASVEYAGDTSGGVGLGGESDVFTEKFLHYSSKTSIRLGLCHTSKTGAHFDLHYAWPNRILNALDLSHTSKTDLAPEPLELSHGSKYEILDTWIIEHNHTTGTRIGPYSVQFRDSDQDIFLDGVSIKNFIYDLSLECLETNIHNSFEFKSIDPDIWINSNPETLSGQSRIQITAVNEDFYFLVEEREKLDEHTFIVKGRSLTAIDDKPYAVPIEAGQASGMANTVISGLLSRSVSWEIDDWLLPAFDLVDVPARVVKEIIKNVAILRSDPDGNFIVRRKRPVRPNKPACSNT
jgi:hypothetical protein